MNDAAKPDDPHCRPVVAPPPPSRGSAGAEPADERPFSSLGVAPARKRVLIVEADDARRELALRMVSTDPRLVVSGVASTAATAVRLLVRVRAQVVLLDADLPDGMAEDFIAWLRRARLTSRTVLLTSRAEVPALAAATGADASFSRRDNWSDVLSALAAGPPR